VIRICYLVLGIWSLDEVPRETLLVMGNGRGVLVSKKISSKPVTRHNLPFRGLRPTINIHCVNG
jgi:hypothetical protein